MFRYNKIFNLDDKFNRVYMNIDGEFYYIVKPKQLRIRQSRAYPNGQLNFLKKNISSIKSNIVK